MVCYVFELGIAYLCFKVCAVYLAELTLDVALAFENFQHFHGLLEQFGEEAAQYIEVRFVAQDCFNCVIE